LWAVSADENGSNRDVMQVCKNCSSVCWRSKTWQTGYNSPHQPVGHKGGLRFSCCVKLLLPTILRSQLKILAACLIPSADVRKHNVTSSSS